MLLAFLEIIVNNAYLNMTASEIQLVSESIAFHPPVIIITLSIFMYIRGKIIEKKAPLKVLSESTSSNL